MHTSAVALSFRPMRTACVRISNVERLCVMCIGVNTKQCVPFSLVFPPCRDYTCWSSSHQRNLSRQSNYKYSMNVFPYMLTISNAERLCVICVEVNSKQCVPFPLVCPASLIYE